MMKENILQKEDILQRDISGELIMISDSDYEIFDALQVEAQKIIAELNTGYHTKEEVRALFSKLTGTTVSDDFWVMPPFYTDFGRNIRVGKGVFINHACEFMDRGGITLEDGVLIGPKVNLITTSHPLDPETRRGTVSRPIHIRKNAFLGAAVTVMPGVTIGENAVVSAGSVVTDDVEANTVVGGVPAKMIKRIEI